MALAIDRAVMPDNGLRNILRQVPPGAVLYYPGLDYGNWYTTKIKDYSGNANDGTIVEATWTRLPSGLWGLSFDGDDYVSCADLSTMLFTKTSAFSIMTWVYPTFDAANRMIITNIVTTDAYKQWTLELNNNIFNAFIGFHDGTWKRIFCASSTYTTSGWYHIVATFTGTVDQEKIYVKGIDDTHIIESDATNFSYSVAHPVILGRRGNLGDTFYKGKVGLISVFNRTLTPTEIANFYNQTRWMFGV